jgi:O-antigen ligase
LAIVIPLILFGINLLIDYKSTIEYRSLNDLVKFFYFIPLAWWAGGSKRGAINQFTIVIFGLVTAVLLSPDLLRSLVSLFDGVRVDFGIHNAQHAALFFGITFLFGITGIVSLKRTSSSGLIEALFIFSSIIGMYGFIGANTRAAYLGLLACGLLSLTFIIGNNKHFRQRGLSYLRIAFVLVCVTKLSFGFVGELKGGRFSQEQASFESIVQGNIKDLSFSSSGIRIHSWLEAIKWIEQRPLTGWGSEARADVIKKSEIFPEEIKSRFGHLHSGYLETLLGFGLVGLVFLFYFWVGILGKIKISKKIFMYRFMLFSSLFFLVMNVFESFFYYWSGIFSMSVIIAGAYSIRLKNILVT